MNDQEQNYSRNLPNFRTPTLAFDVQHECNAT